MLFVYMLKRHNVWFGYSGDNKICMHAIELMRRYRIILQDIEERSTVDYKTYLK